MTDTRQDILLDDTGNYLVASGDFSTGESDNQHVEMLLLSGKGFIREYPTVGVGIGTYLKKQTTDLTQLKRDVMVNLKGDGYKSGKLTIDENNEFDLTYERNY